MYMHVIYISYILHGDVLSFACISAKLMAYIKEYELNLVCDSENQSYERT